MRPLRQTIGRKTSYSSINGILLMLYLFVSVNDIVLVPFGMLWLKNVLLFFLFLGLLIKQNFGRNKYFSYLLIAGFLFVASFTIAASYGNNFNYALPENLGLFVALIMPLIVLNWINVNPIKIFRISYVFLWSIIFATLHKILFILYL